MENFGVTKVFFTPSLISNRSLSLLDSQSGEGVDRLLKATTEDAELDEPEKWLLCAHCGHEITSHNNRIERMGSHIHIFNNPVGIQFEIGCFSQAVGCYMRGEPVSEWTWFTGYRWCYTHCASCHTHLGWHYSGTDGNGFFGLILEALRGQH